MKKLFFIAMLHACACPVVFAGGGEPATKKTPATQDAKLVLRFRPRVDNRPLVLNDSSNHYKNANGDDYVVTTFKYYVSNVCLIRRNGEKVLLPDSYLLVNSADSASLEQALPAIPAGKYTAIEFIIGVDSARNFAGAQTGCLDPARGMFWNWNTGYIFVKMEGVSSKSTARQNRLTFHIGGAKSPNNTVRTFTQPLPHTLKVRNGHAPRIDVDVNAAALFRGKTQVDFAKLNFTMGGPNSVVIADNYAEGLFTVTGVQK